MAVVDELRAANATIVQNASHDLTRFFWSYAGADPVELKEALLLFYPEFVATYGDMAGVVAAEFYDTMRSEAGVRGAHNTRLAAPPPPEQAANSARWAVQPAFADDWDAALLQLLGTSERLIRLSGRETMSSNALEDRAAAGYKRMTRAGSCRFCRMLADRGGVYSRGTAYFASHNNCRCEVVPSWERNPRPVGVMQYKMSESSSKMSDQQLERRRAQLRAYLNEHYPTES